MNKKLEARIARLERLVYRKAKNESTVTNLHELALRLEILLHNKGIKWFDVKAYSDKVDVSFNWEEGGGDFFIMPSKDGGYIVDGEYYVEKFDTIQQVVDYLEHEDSKNSW